jgi:hypothetical protein
MSDENSSPLKRLEHIFSPRHAWKPLKRVVCENCGGMFRTCRKSIRTEILVLDPVQSGEPYFHTLRYARKVRTLCVE